MTDQGFTILEELMLLSLDERSGRLLQPNLRYALSAAAIGELLQRGCIRVEMGRVEARHSDSIGDSALDPALRRIVNERRTRKLTWWLRNLYPTVRQPVDAIAQRLIECGAVTRRERTALLVIHWADYPILEPAFVQRLRRRIHAALKGQEPIETRLAVLIAILHHSQGMDAVMDRAEQREYERRIVGIVSGNEAAFTLGKAISEVLQEDREAHERAHRHIIVITHPRKPHPPRRPGRGRGPTFPGEPPPPHRPWRQADAQNRSR